ncbi:hypothetical protein ILYODFUR_039173 [Ilyodon furcidens]|uniref:Uncharacterized protein n=1 Tax=Ilyodon furcidens TaxID=33524 RepID=A0ABV0SWJ4_9TELE
MQFILKVPGKSVLAFHIVTMAVGPISSPKTHLPNRCTHRGITTILWPSKAQNQTNVSVFSLHQQNEAYVFPSGFYNVNAVVHYYPRCLITWNVIKISSKSKEN